MAESPRFLEKVEHVHFNGPSIYTDRASWYDWQAKLPRLSGRETFDRGSSMEACSASWRGG